MRRLSRAPAAKVRPAAQGLSVAGAAVQFGEFAARSSLPNGFEGSRPIEMGPLTGWLSTPPCANSVIEPTLVWPY